MFYSYVICINNKSCDNYTKLTGEVIKMLEEVWKSFDENNITHSVAHHLMSILELTQAHGYARVSDIARNLDITRGSVSITLRPLKMRGYILQDSNKFLQLSPEGENLAQAIQSKRKIFIKFFDEVLKVSPVQAEIDACKVEHLISDQTAEKLLSFLRFLFQDNKETHAFLAAFEKHQDGCTDLEKCPVCDEGECLMHQS